MFLVKIVGYLFSGTARPMNVFLVTDNERGFRFRQISVNFCSELSMSCLVLVWLSRMYETLLVGEFSSSWKRRK